MKVVNKKGYTLVELLAVIVIIAMLSSVAVMVYSQYISASKDKVFTSYEDSMHAEAVMYFLNHPLINDGSTKRITLSELDIKPINNPLDGNDKCPNSYVSVKRENNGIVTSMKYTVCLICNDYNNCRDYVD